MNKQDEYKQTGNHPSILYLNCRTQTEEENCERINKENGL